MKTTRIIAACVAVLISTISTSTSTATATAVPPYRLGDVDEDGMITASDASTVLHYYTELSAGGDSDASLPTKYTYLADVDRDGKITASDATAILRYYCDESSGVEPQWPEFQFKIGTSYRPLSDIEIVDGSQHRYIGEPFLVVSFRGNRVWVYLSGMTDLVYLEGLDPTTSSGNFARLEY